MLWLCFQLPSCLFGNTRNTSVMHEYASAKSEIQICSNKHETGLIFNKEKTHARKQQETSTRNVSIGHGPSCELFMIEFQSVHKVLT